MAVTAMAMPMVVVDLGNCRCIAADAIIVGTVGVPDAVAIGYALSTPKKITIPFPASKDSPEKIFKIK